MKPAFTRIESVLFAVAAAISLLLCVSCAVGSGGYNGTWVGSNHGSNSGGGTGSGGLYYSPSGDSQNGDVGPSQQQVQQCAGLSAATAFIDNCGNILGQHMDDLYDNCASALQTFFHANHCDGGRALNYALSNCQQDLSEGFNYLPSGCQQVINSFRH